MFNAYFFDLDGTLCDSLGDLTAAANAVRRANGQRELSRERVQGYVGNGITKLLHRVLRDDFNGAAEEQSLAAARAVFTDYYRRHICVHTRLYPGVKEGLARLHSAGKTLAVISNKDEDLARQLLADLQIAEYFALVYGGDRFPERKPAPRPLQAALVELQLAPATTLMVGDSDNDIGAARAAGLPVAYFRGGFGGPALAGRADFAYDHFHELEHYQ